MILLKLKFPAVNLGIHFPLNGRFLGERLDAVHHALESKDFLLDNENRHAQTVDLNE